MAIKFQIIYQYNSFGVSEIGTYSVVEPPLYSNTISESRLFFLTLRMQIFQGGLILGFLVLNEMKKVVDLPNHVLIQSAVRNDSQVLPHAQFF